MATKRSSGPIKKTPRTRKKAAVETVVETAPTETTSEPVTVASLAPMDAAEPPVSVDEIRRRAYNYWVQGSPDPIANWFRAENELKQH